MSYFFGTRFGFFSFNKKIVSFLIIFVLGLFFYFSESQALTISPAKIILSADPGQTLETTMSVGHGFDQPTTYYPVIEGYTVKGGDEPVYIPEGIGLPTWIETVPSELTLGPKETKNVLVRIKVPEDAPPGGHYAVIFWSTASPKTQGTGVGVITRVGAIVFLEVSGQVIESGEIVNFKALRKMVRSLPVGFEYGFENKGTVHLKPDGEVLIKNVFGKTVAILNANPSQAYVLPQTTRMIPTENWQVKKETEELKGKFEEVREKGFLTGLKAEIEEFHLGYYKANLFVEYGKERKLAKAGFGFWIVPWRILLIGLFLLALILWLVTRGIRKYNQWVIGRAKTH